MKILLLEDDKVLLESLGEYLGSEGFEVDLAKNANEAYELTFKNSYDLYIFDINLPDENGLNVLQALQNAHDDTPTIYISALTDISTLSKAFNLGAIDYLKKPFDPEELVLRIKSKLKPQNQFVYNDIVYDVKRDIFLQNEKIINLGQVQSALLKKLIKNKNKIVPTNELLDLLDTPNNNALRVNIAKLKNKLNLKIKNIRSQGYMLEEI